MRRGKLIDMNEEPRFDSILKSLLKKERNTLVAFCFLLGVVTGIALGFHAAKFYYSFPTIEKNEKSR